MRHRLSNRAGILAMSALVFLCSAIGHAATDLAPEILDAVAQSHWAETRGYDTINDTAERHAVIREVLRSSACLAQRFRESGCQLTPEARAQADDYHRVLLRHALTEHIAAQLDIADEELDRIAHERGLLRETPERFRVSLIHIALPPEADQETAATKRETAEQIAKQATPENFAELALLFSESPSAPRGGSLGLVTLDTGVGPLFAQQVRETPPGTITGPHQTPAGWNIVWVQNHIPAAPPTGIETIRQRVRWSLAADEVARIEQAGEWDAAITEHRIADDPKIAALATAHENTLYIRHCLTQELLAEDVEPTEQELRRIYDEHPGAFQRGQSHRARAILLTDDNWDNDTSPDAWRRRFALRDRIRDLREQALAGEDFAELARQHSAHPSAPDGGDIGWITPPTDADLDRALARLQPGNVSLPILRPDGWLLLRLEETRTEPPVTFDEALPRLREAWWSRRYREREATLRAACTGED